MNKESSYNLPPQSGEIFEQLSRGLFISKNTPASPITDYYALIQAHEESYREYFQVIGYKLENGKDFYFFSKEENRSQVEDKLEKLFRYVDGLEMLFELAPQFQAGITFKVLDWQSNLNSDKRLAKKALSLPGKANMETPLDKVRNFCRSMEKESFFALLDESTEEYLVLDAFQYLVDVIMSIDTNS